MSTVNLNISNYASMLASRAEEVARLLLPNGKKKGVEWVVGDISGASGNSLCVCLNGEKAGIFCDFASSEHSGDLIELWRLTKNLSMKDTITEVKAFLGISAPSFTTSQGSKKKYTKPNKPECHVPKSDVKEYLNSRGLNDKTIKAFKVAEKGKDTIVFPYLKDEGLLNVKYLGVKRENGKKKTWQEKNAQPCLFGWQAVPEDAREISITEGEIDAMTLWQCGKPALSIPIGGGKGNKHVWVEHEWDDLERFEKIYLVMDMDEVGADSVLELVERLGRHRCHIVELPLKDANECIENGMEEEDIVQFYDVARTIDPDELKGAVEFTESVMNEFYPVDGKIPGFETPWEGAKKKFRVRNSEVSIWTGINGHGKSQCLGHLFVHGLALGEKGCVASLEIKPAKLLRRMVIQSTGKKMPTQQEIYDNLDWFDEKLWLFDVTGTAKVDKLFEVFEYARKRYGIKHFLIDSLMKCGIADDDYSGQKFFVERLCDFVNEYDCHIHLVAHSRKGENEGKLPGKLDVKGSGSISDLAHNCFTVWRNKAKEEKIRKLKSLTNLSEEEAFAEFDKLQQEPDALLICDKQREGDWEGKIPLYFNVESYQYTDNWTSDPFDYVHTKVFDDRVEDEDGNKAEKEPIF